MRESFVVAAIICLSMPSTSLAVNTQTDEFTPYIDRAAGGPDAFGYTWADSNEPGGPVFNWVDITGIGTQVTGLADDNSVPLIPMGMDFTYYWITFSDIKIGSNGWLSFNNVSNVAHCFPVLPTPGSTGDNLVAPFMSDLNFSEPGNPAAVYYFHDTDNQEFIVSYIDVPWWVNSNPAYIGSNTFQVIFSAIDNSITYQYLDMDPANFNDTAGCAHDLSIGFENTTGNIGLEISSETVPPDNYAIRITYPDPVLFNIIDLAPIWNQNDQNSGRFSFLGQEVTLLSRVKNTGNTDAVNDIDVTMQVFDDQNMSIYTESDTLMGLVAQGEIDVISSNLLITAAGTYRHVATTTSAEDINPSNNVNESELVIVDTSQAPLTLSFTDANSHNGVISWNGGNGGAGVFISPPEAGWSIYSVEMFVVAGGGAGADYTVSIFANDNGDGLPGTLLDSVVVPEGSYTFDTWVETVMNSLIEAPTEGFFVTWEQINAEGVSLGRDDNRPFSFNSIEQLGGQWATYRRNDASDLMIRANLVDVIFADGFD